MNTKFKKCNTSFQTESESYMKSITEKEYQKNDRVSIKSVTKQN